MKKTVTAVLCSLILLTGCGAQDNITKKAASIIPNDAVISPDGKLAVCQYVKEDLEDEKGLLYSIYDVQLYDNEKYIMICTFHIVGRDFHFIWSPNSKYVTAAYSGRIWTNFSILDIRRHSTISILGISEILDSFRNSGEKIDYEINEDRPDPYVSPIEWSPDSTRILISYQVKDAGYKTQSGIFIYDLVNNTYSDLRQLPSSEDDHVNIRKPENFSWE
jgi:hypothetical protein